MFWLTRIVRRRRSPTTATRHAARHGWTFSLRRNPAQTQTHTEGEAGLARAEHEEAVSVTIEVRKAGSDRRGRLGQDGRRGPKLPPTKARRKVRSEAH